MRRSLLRAAMAVAFAAVLAPPVAGAQERPLIWEFRKNSDTFYAARFGSRLPIGAEAGIGAEISVRGPDLAGLSDPVLLWAMLKTQGEELPGAKRTTRINLRAHGIAGKRTLVVDNALSGQFGMMDAEFVQHHAFDHEPAGDGKIRIRTTRSIKLSSAHAGTTLIARASRAHDTQWRTSVGIEQPLSRTVRFSAAVEEPGTESRKGMFRASYNHRW